MIELKKISGGYGEELQLENITLKFPKFAVTTIIGPNGCGKSTLLRILCGLKKPWSGEVLIEGKPLPAFSQKELARTISFLPQNRNLPNIRVESLVLHGRFPYMEYPRRYRSADREKAREALAWAGVLSLANKPVAELSGGERQKVYIAMLLAQDTPVVLMDEPTSYLDISYKFEVMKLARRLKEAGKTVVLVLHDLDLALSCSDKVILMDKGQIQMAGTPEEVYVSGKLQEVFRVQAYRTELEGNAQYFFSPL